MRAAREIEAEVTEDLLLDEGKRGRPKPRHSKAQFIMLLTALYVSNFGTALDSSLSASGHVAIASSFGKTNLSTWPVNAFLITSLTCQPLYARLSDLVGRKLPYVAASALFTSGIALSAFAPSWAFLIFGRSMCGLGVAGIMTMGSVVLTDVVGVEKRGYYQSINYVNYGMGSAIGSAIGGAIIRRLGWSYVYKIQLPVCLLATCLLVVFLPPKQASMSDKSTLLNSVREFDWRGSLSMMASLLCLFVVLGFGGNIFPWTHPLILSAAFCFVVTCALFVRIESKALKPILPLDVFKFPTRNLILTGFLFSMINYTVMYNTAMFFQTVKLDDIERAGARLVVPSISFTAISAISASIIARVKSPRPTLLASQALLLIGTVGLFTMAAVFPSYGVPDAVYSLMLISPMLGVGMMAPSTVLALLDLTDPGNHAVINGGLITARSLGVFVATAMSTTIVQNVFGASIPQNVTGEERKQIEAVRLDVNLLESLDKDLQQLVINAFQNGFIWLFGVCFVSSMIIVLTLLRVPTGYFSQRKNGHGQGAMRMPQVRNSMEETSPKYHRVASDED